MISLRPRASLALVLTVAFAALPVPAASVAPPQGVPNFHQVGEHVYRGGQPTQEGVKNLARIGIQTVINLRGASDQERFEENAVRQAGMRYVDIPLSGFKAPSDEQIANVLARLNDSSGWPVFVHCKRGADRTGTAVACYRIAHDHWSNRQALAEAKSYGMSSLERAMQHYILRFETAEIEALEPPPGK